MHIQCKLACILIQSALVHGKNWLMHLQTPISVTNKKSLQYTFITTGADGMTMLLAIVHA